MTGFGKAQQNEDFQVNIEIKSVNSRYLDINFKETTPLVFLEQDLRKAIQEKIKRGKVSVFIDYKPAENNIKITANKALAKAYLDELDKLIDLDIMIKPSIDIGLLSHFDNVLEITKDEVNDEEIKEQILPIFNQALEELEKAREQEGENLAEDIKSHLETVKKITNKIKEEAPQAIKESIEKLKSRILEFLDTTPFNETIFLNEVAVLSDKKAIDEEITRLNSHIKSLETLMKEEGAIGRKMDFLIQELNREINTIGNKTESLTILNLVVELKSELEKIREQVQNIE